MQVLSTVWCVPRIRTMMMMKTKMMSPRSASMYRSCAKPSTHLCASSMLQHLSIRVRSERSRSSHPPPTGTLSLSLSLSLSHISHSESMHVHTQLHRKASYLTCAILLIESHELKMCSISLSFSYCRSSEVGACNGRPKKPV